MNLPKDIRKVFVITVIFYLSWLPRVLADSERHDLQGETRVVFRVTLIVGLPPKLTSF